jgi:hypothetical protein
MYAYNAFCMYHKMSPIYIPSLICVILFFHVYEFMCGVWQFSVYEVDPWVWVTLLGYFSSLLLPARGS